MSTRPSKRAGSASRCLRATVVTLILATLGACGSGTTNSSGEDVPEGITHVHGLGLTGQTLFVATHFGLWTQTDGEWSRRSSDRADHMGFSLISDRLMFRSGHPETGGNLGVQRSTDGGRTWETVSDVLDSPVDFHAMTSSRSEPATLYGWSADLFRSEGDAERWEAVKTAGLPPQIGALALSDSGELFASTGLGVFASKDGEKWQRRSDEQVFALTADGDIVYASKGQRPGVQRSKDGGRSWEDISDGLGSAPIVALATLGRQIVAADQESSIWRSEDGGKKWSRVQTP